ncbi:hypothetical protein GPECTOR_90g519 [Gonium pectorale]|uniref:Uncharacterized protein n=1 Tax=Gonium pectorale TaxID=33097 RepID=A0A150G0L9_GONPE|nr:hypothetical protein GPECTOR_90g519 [Gonium pectorale]|eukprot:KXZ43433.1 hypothetical protein GPECTOR_90g519 [Gonium pectorale]
MILPRSPQPGIAQTACGPRGNPPLGQQIIQEGPTPVPWKQQLLVQLVGYKSYNQATAVFKELAKAKGGKAAAGAAGGARGPQDIFKQMMRSRLPPMTFFVEQMTEGVLKPEGWATMESVVGLGDEITEDEEAETFNHAYYRHMYDMALRGDPWAQREYAAMLRSYDKARETFRASYHEAELDHLMEYGPESYVVDPIDFGPSFDPEDLFSHRHAYAEAADSGVNVIPSQDYYGHEHDDPLNGIVFQYESQPFSRHGWGGVPLDLTVCLEKDKTSLCLQGESHLSLVHSVPPFGPRHITQGPTGGKEEGWGARAFVHYDWLPGVGIALDFIQERTPEEGGKRLRGYGANVTYDWELLGAAFGLEVDYVAASESIFVSVNAFSGNDYRLGWLLLLPAVNYAKETLAGLWARLRGTGGAEEGEEEEEDAGEGEEEEGEEDMEMAEEGDL